ncbi:subunit of TIM23 translocase complex [Lobosporangium transversale]|uniref:Reactive mitochondrial oxygen species modulator 1-domain-containing protein n=1 Tax=Lobosporangium transversale TaxID=64571 RepID=A0A1Y2GRY1_9FUNG|nr:reactive mitochondrial oxygen species modulator 1-domain-containing protein [Lobosporangium transversale]KAF9913680.1 subunit of TIM23 translocase complex [Lobosporangium transversale]ORZ20908.1 reactive mitochondrial oxygen species modulator 1-domain-containing protein [Lobosporangium transversale]|eukprot:XP_021882817.1 reactive mitochondrial oxygen species modulator 1-domain-containing protein [Lobosporangium transversale]
MEPSKFERAKVGAMMGGAVGLCIGLVFGGFSVLRNGPGSRGYVNTLAQTMISSTATFAFFMAIGSVIRSEEATAIDYAALDQNHGKKNLFGGAKCFRTPPIVILQRQQQQQKLLDQQQHQ